MWRKEKKTLPPPGRRRSSPVQPPISSTITPAPTVSPPSAIAYRKKVFIGIGLILAATVTFCAFWWGLGFIPRRRLLYGCFTPPSASASGSSLMASQVISWLEPKKGPSMETSNRQSAHHMPIGYQIRGRAYPIISSIPAISPSKSQWIEAGPSNRDRWFIIPQFTGEIWNIIIKKRHGIRFTIKEGIHQLYA
ncbi:MAG: hypothetical protein QM755_16985 [Luteolibacter sp.]